MANADPTADDDRRIAQPLLGRRRRRRQRRRQTPAEPSPLTWFAVALVRGMVGPAALYMPAGFREAGVLGGVLTVVVANLLFFLGIHRLIDCWRVVAAQNGEARTATAVARALGGAPAEAVATFCVVVLQLGTCVTYFIFTGQALARAFPAVFQSRKAVVVGVMAAAQAALAGLRKDGGEGVRGLRGANAAGNVFVGVSLLTIAAAKVAHAERRGLAEDVVLTAPSLSGVALFGGTAVFAFEGGAAVLIPAACEVKEAADRQRVGTVACGVVAAIAASYTAFGLAVYLAEGKNTPVIASLALDGPLARAVNLCYACVVVLTFPLQLLPATQILFPSDTASGASRHKTLSLDDEDAAATLLPSAGNDDDDTPREEDESSELLLLEDEEDVVPKDATSSSAALSVRRYLRRGGWRRAVLVIIVAAVALAFREKLDHVVALLGAVSTAPFALVLGPLLHFKAKGADQSRAARAVDLALAVVGALLTVATTALTVRSWNSGRS